MTHTPVRAARAPRRAFLAVVAAALAAAACGTTSPAAPGPSATQGPASPADAPAAASASGGWTEVESGVPGDAMGVRAWRLRNGLTVYLSESHDEPRVDAWITVRAGGAKDPAEATGIAHYLEHMQFKGTTRLGTIDWEKEKPHLDRITMLYELLHGETDPEKRRALYAQIDGENQLATKYSVPNEFDRLYDGLGASRTNAFTSNDQTSYVTNVPSNRIEQWAMVETERLREPVYRLFQTELEAVYEEKNQSFDSAGRAMNEALMNALFPGHPYGTQTILGSAEHLKNPSLARMYEYFRTWYQPENMCVALAGDIDPAKVLPILDRTLGTLPSRPAPADPKWPMPALGGVKRIEVQFKGEEQLVLAFPTVPESHPDHDALILCDMMLGNGQTGLIDRNLNQAQKVRGAGCQPQSLLEGGFQLLSAAPLTGQSLDELEVLLLDQVKLLKAGQFDDADLAAAITQFEIQEKRGLESTNNRVAAMTEAFIQRVRWAEKAGAIARLKKVTRAEVVAAANKWFGDSYVAVRRRNGDPALPKISKPNFTPVPIDPNRPHSPFFQAVLAADAPPIEPQFVQKGREVDETKIASGTFVHARNPVNDVFDLTFTIPGGTDHDPKLDLAFDLLELGGAGEMDGVALKRKLFALGSSFSAAASREEVTISVSGLDANLKATVDLLRSHFEKPTGVGDEDLAQLVGRTLAGRKADKSSPRSVVQALHEFGRRGAESNTLKQPKDAELLSWKAADLFASAKAVWDHPRTVTYVGQLPPAEVAAIVDLGPIGGTVADLTPPLERKPLRWVRPEKSRVLFLDQRAAQAQIQFHIPDGEYDRPSVPLTRVYNEMLGGSMSGIVFQEIRESRALAYGAGASYNVPGRKGDENILIGALSCQADKSVDAIAVMTDILRKFPGTPSRFDAARRSIDEGYRANRVAFRRLPGTWVAWTQQGLDGDPRPWNRERVKTLTLEELMEWTKRFSDVPFTITIAGPKASIDLERLKQFGDVQEVTADQLFAW